MHLQQHLNKAAIASLALGCQLVCAQVVEGVLETGPIYSALFTVSRESGDLIGQAFRNQSAVGSQILANCLSRMLCQIAQGSTRELADPRELKFEDEPQGWREITAVQDVTMKTVVFGHDKSSRTRFGVVAIREQDNQLTFRGAPAIPSTADANPLAVVAKYEIGARDVLLLQETGGIACPALFWFVTITANEVSTTGAFGSCSDVIYPRRTNQSITISMPGFAGPFETEIAKRKAARTRNDYVFLNGKVTLGGKPIK